MAARSASGWLTGLAWNVGAMTARQPAAAYCRCSAVSTSGCASTHASVDTPRGIPAAMRLEPVAPSSSSGPWASRVEKSDFVICAPFRRCVADAGTRRCGLAGSPAEAFGWSCLRRAPFHRGKGAKTRRWLRPPDPGEQAAVRHRRAGVNVSCCRLGEFLRGCRCAARIMRPREFDSSCCRRNADEWPHRLRTLSYGPRSTQPGIINHLVILSKAKNPPLPLRYGFFGPYRASE